MNEHDKQVSGVEATANSAPSTGRRRLIKSVILATPAIMTLRSGAVRAALSATNCTVPCNPQGGAISFGCLGSLFPNLDDDELTEKGLEYCPVPDSLDQPLGTGSNGTSLN